LNFGLEAVLYHALHMLFHKGFSQTNGSSDLALSNIEKRAAQLSTLLFVIQVAKTSLKKAVTYHLTGKFLMDFTISSYKFVLFILTRCADYTRINLKMWLKPTLPHY